MSYFNEPARMAILNIKDQLDKVIEYTRNIRMEMRKHKNGI